MNVVIHKAIYNFFFGSNLLAYTSYYRLIKLL